MKFKDQLKSTVPTWPEFTSADLKILGIVFLILLLGIFIRFLSGTPSCHSDYQSCLNEQQLESY